MCRRLLLIAAAITASIEAGSASYHPGISSDYSGYPGFPVYPSLTSSESSSIVTTTPTTSLENAPVCRYDFDGLTCFKKINVLIHVPHAGHPSTCAVPETASLRTSTAMVKMTAATSPTSRDTVAVSFSFDASSFTRYQKV